VFGDGKFLIGQRSYFLSSVHEQLPLSIVIKKDEFVVTDVCVILSCYNPILSSFGLAIVWCSSRTLKFEDPFNNPLVKVGKKNPIIKMCGKLFRLAPVTLTEEKRVSHQSRRVQAYKWKRPSVFLVEGEPVPEGVDPEEVRWIPSNHPFATTKNYIEEGLAQQNVYQTRGVPSRVKAEHEALRKKMMEAASKVHILSSTPYLSITCILHL
jgi:hypothetical protein